MRCSLGTVVWTANAIDGIEPTATGCMKKSPDLFILDVDC